MELSLIMKMDQGETDPQSISNSILAYSKSQNGSEEFYRAMESFILQNKGDFNCQELANLVYSYHKSENAQKEILKDL